MSDILRLIGRTEPLFRDDLSAHDEVMRGALRSERILVVGAAGSIGRAVTRELFMRSPAALHAVDVSENNLAELVRDIRSSLGYIEGEFKTFCVDCGAVEFEALIADQPPYDYILNFSALKHVRSEKDPYSLMRMVSVNVLYGEKLLNYAAKVAAKKYFAVSTDKAANPVNMMGASKRIMEMCMMREGRAVPFSTARFANVAFSEGSLLDSFTRRIRRRQPLAAPRDVKRYFITAEEAGQLCLLSACLGQGAETFFPKLSAALNLITFSEIAINYLESLGYSPYVCESEDEARSKMAELYPQRRWPCYFFDSDTTGEKEFEEFYTAQEKVVWDRFQDIAVIKNDNIADSDKLDSFIEGVNLLRSKGSWTKADLVTLFRQVLGDFAHKETFKYLDDRM